MATLVLQTAGSVIGSLVGGPIGAAVGGVIGSTVGSVIDASMISSGTSGRGGRKISYGPRLKDLDGISSTEGAAIPRLYGRARLGGQVIWATRLEEEQVLSSTRPRGGKGGIGGSKPKASVEVSFRYYANVAIALCEGQVAFVRRVWADGKPVDLTGITMRLHVGDEMQPADPLIIAKQGASGAPAYRGIAYVVFERLALENFGNRLPQFTFEVVRPVHGLCRRIRAVTIIPGAGEYVYEPSAMSVARSFGASSLPNRTQLTHVTDWHASIDALQALCPNLQHVSLVITWFGNDLRVGNCTVRPLTEPGSIDGNPYSWSVAGMTRGTAGTVSAPNGQPAFGGTPSDGSVLRAIRDLRARGLLVTLYPFVMMDVPPANTLPDPWTGNAKQPVYPWRGRITCDPAPGRAGTVEGTAAAATQVSAFMGNCLASQFTVGVDTVSYSGPIEWTLRRLVLHTAALGKAAGGVDTVVIGSEFVALTRVRGIGATNPAVLGLKALATEVRALSGAATKITYGADWSEYGAEVRSGGQDVRFPLDPLWADANIDAVAIDWYPPVTDWRDGQGHLDFAVYDGPHDPQMFEERQISGESFNWYYASDANRIAQIRTPITDGAANKPWVFRAKDIAGWWSNLHYHRVAGAELETPTAWVAGSKPVWMLELGCPAVDRGGNAPNVFPDPKSSENALPPFSRAMRDDLVQARALTAAIDRFDPARSGFASAANPLAALYSGRMVDLSRIYLWTWDARPFPAFPAYSGRWADAENFSNGHWLNGRIEGAPIDDLLGAVLTDYGAMVPARINADGFVDGYVIDRPMSARAVIEPLADVFGFDALVSAGALRFVRRSARPVASLALDDLAVSDDNDRPLRMRAQDSELPTVLTLGFTEADADFRQATVRVAVASVSGERVASAEIAAGLASNQAVHRAEVMLNESRAGRTTIEFLLPPSRLDIEPGDVASVDGKPYRLRRITDGRLRVMEAVAVEPAIYLGAPRPSRAGTKPVPAFAGPPLAIVMDLAAASAGTPVLHRLAVAADPWPGAYTLWRSEDGSSFTAVQRIATRATVGETITVLAAGPIWRVDRANSVDVMLSQGALESVAPEAALNGANLIAIEASGQGWEILSYTTADLIAAGRWRLSGLLRGLAGSEVFASVVKPLGSRVVILDGGVVDLAIGTEWLNRTVNYRLSPEGRDHADPMAVAFMTTAGPIALKPLSPVRLKAKREAGGVRFSWIRRTRFGGDNWELAEVPLNEETEDYAVDVLSGTTFKRRLNMTSPTALYASADEIADFGAAQANLLIRVSQTSLAAGDGQTAEQLLPVF
jgi:GTA TIM-barrel-like domain/Putative phage tail protein